VGGGLEKISQICLREARTWDSPGTQAMGGGRGLRRRDRGGQKERGGSKMRSQGPMKTLVVQQLK